MTPLACLRCRYRWLARVPNPAACARCGSAFWDTPRLPTGKHRYGHVEARRCRKAGGTRCKSK